MPKPCRLVDTVVVKSSLLGRGSEGYESPSAGGAGNNQKYQKGPGKFGETRLDGVKPQQVQLRERASLVMLYKAGLVISCGPLFVLFLVTDAPYSISVL